MSLNPIKTGFSIFFIHLMAVGCGVKGRPTVPEHPPFIRKGLAPSAESLVASPTPTPSPISSPLTAPGREVADPENAKPKVKRNSKKGNKQ